MNKREEDLNFYLSCFSSLNDDINDLRKEKDEIETILRKFEIAKKKVLLRINILSKEV